MGLITKEVEVTLCGTNIKYYEDLGYEIPRYKDKIGRRTVKRGTIISVRVEDLSNGSGERINAKCDECGELSKPMQYFAYTNYIHEDGKYYCKKCTMSLFANKKLNTTLLKKKNAKSFYDWCLDNNRFDIILRWDFKLNSCSPQDILYRTNKKYYFRCPKNIHPSELKCISNFTSGNEGTMNCKACNSVGQYICDTYGKDKLNYYWSWIDNIDENGESLNPFSISKRCNKMIYIYCQEHSYHGSYIIQCASFVAGHRCGFCANRQIHPFDSLGYYIIKKFGKEFLDNIWSKKNKKSPFEYSINSSIQMAYFKCLDSKHNDTYRSISNATKSNFRCPKCIDEMNESILQKKVRLYLEDLNLGQVLHEHQCTIVPINPKTKHCMPFDNEIKELKFVIEVMGQQHYQISGWNIKHSKKTNTTPEYELYRTQLYDRYKKIYAHLMGYEYIAIPYWTDNDKEDWKYIVNNKLNEILKYKEVF